MQPRCRSQVFILTCPHCLEVLGQFVSGPAVHASRTIHFIDWNMWFRKKLAQGRTLPRRLVESRAATYRRICLRYRPNGRAGTHDAYSRSGIPLSLLAAASDCCERRIGSATNVHGRPSRVGESSAADSGQEVPLAWIRITGLTGAWKSGVLEGKNSFTRDMAQVLRKLVLVQRYNLRCCEVLAKSFEFFLGTRAACWSSPVQVL